MSLKSSISPQHRLQIQLLLSTLARRYWEYAVTTSAPLAGYRIILYRHFCVSPVECESFHSFLPKSPWSLFEAILTLVYTSYSTTHTPKDTVFHIASFFHLFVPTAFQPGSLESLFCFNHYPDEYFRLFLL